MTKEEGRKAGLSNFPNFGPNGSVTGMRARYYGPDALLVRCGAYVYNVTGRPDIYGAAK
jgi:hypothetical protein